MTEYFQLDIWILSPKNFFLLQDVVINSNSDSNFKVFHWFLKTQLQVIDIELSFLQITTTVQYSLVTSYLTPWNSEKHGCHNVVSIFVRFQHNRPSYDVLQNEPSFYGKGKLINCDCSQLSTAMQHGSGKEQIKLPSDEWLCQLLFLLNISVQSSCLCSDAHQHR